MGFPLTAIALLVTVWAVRRVDKRDKAREEAEKAETDLVERELRAKYDAPAQESP
nr:PROBABLE CONSERVED INTEGRAL MEMBRANE ALANINE AND LEUCINE RICH PROTEIN [Kibdelosporangium sp. MJ126-NF4]CTQ96680.1 PROBABLE CONSERVED INTEGRAL MEMBRANE ALANINE AND LEUCINE RICH PROTEIN [Kibdelosporangium sp. MJ126-NF4]